MPTKDQPGPIWTGGGGHFSVAYYFDWQDPAQRDIHALVMAATRAIHHHGYMSLLCRGLFRLARWAAALAFFIHRHRCGNSWVSRGDGSVYVEPRGPLIGLFRV